MMPIDVSESFQMPQGVTYVASCLRGTYTIAALGYDGENQDGVVKKPATGIWNIHGHVSSHVRLVNFPEGAFHSNVEAK